MSIPVLYPTFILLNMHHTISLAIKRLRSSRRLCSSLLEGQTAVASSPSSLHLSVTKCVDRWFMDAVNANLWAELWLHFRGRGLWIKMQCNEYLGAAAAIGIMDV